MIADINDPFSIATLLVVVIIGYEIWRVTSMSKKVFPLCGMIIKNVRKAKTNIMVN